MPERLLNKIVSLDSPYWLQELFGNLSLTSMYLYRLSNMRMFRFRNFVMASQWLPLWRLERYQNERLRRLLSHAYKNVPYYTDIFRKNNLTPDDFSSVRDLGKLPVLTKELLIKNADKLLCRRINKKHLEVVSTGGSTGTPIQVYRDKQQNVIDYIFFERALRMINLNKYSRSVLIWGSPFLKREANVIQIYKPYLKILLLSSLQTDSNKFDKYIGFIRGFRPVFIRGIPSLFYNFARFCRENKINDIHFRVFISYGENLYQHQKQFIEEQFKCTAYNQYLSSERVVTAFECGEHKGMHIDIERGVLEIVDENLQLLPEGHPGKIIATGFHNFAMPLIRYEIGDVGMLSTSPCPCKRSLPLLKSLEGRTSEVLRYKDKCIYPAPLSVAFQRFKTARECQIIQEKEGELILNIVKRESFAEDDRRGIIEYLHNLIDKDLDIKINFVGSIARTKMGKFPFVVSKISK